MPSTLVVLVIALTVSPLIFLLVACTAARLARRMGQQLKSVSWSLSHGITAEFYDNSERKLN